ncbi:MAG: HlyD family secretion protein [Planctomycetota bacterium]
MKKIPIPFHRRLESFKRAGLPVLVWLGSVVGVVLLVQNRGEGYTYRGMVEVTDHVVAASVDGIVTELPVELYGHVEAGQMVARMDASPLLAQLETAGAEIMRIRAEQQVVIASLAADAAEITRDWEKDARRFEMDAVDLRVNLLQEKVDLETDRVDAERARLAFERARKLVNSGVSAAAEVESLELEWQALEQRIAKAEELVAEMESEFERAEARSRDFFRSVPEPLDPEPRLVALRAAARVQELRLAEIEVQREGLLLFAPISGRVQSLAATPGRAVVLGQELMTVTPDAGAAVVFYHPQAVPITVVAGDAVEMHRVGSFDMIEGVVASLAPELGPIPASLWADPAVPEYGRAVRLKPTPGTGWVPGEPVEVRLALE